MHQARVPHCKKQAVQAKAILKGSIYMLNLCKACKGDHLQAGYRPALVIQNDIGNRFSPTVTVIPLSSSPKKALPTHVRIEGCGLNKPSIALCEQILTVNKTQLGKKFGQINSELQESIDNAILIQLGIKPEAVIQTPENETLLSRIKNLFKNKTTMLEKASITM